MPLIDVRRKAPAFALTAVVVLMPGVLATLFLVGNAADLSWADRMLPWLFVMQVIYLASGPARHSV